MKPVTRQRAMKIVVYILCSLVLVAAGSALIREKSYHDDYRYLIIGGDAALYSAMAEKTGEEIPSPFRYRILFPFLASLSDLPAIDAFRLITLVSLFLFYLTGFFLCDMLRYSPLATVMSMVFVFLSPWHLYIYQNPFITDGTVQLTIMVLLFSVLKKNIWLFGMTALAGIFLHERIMFFLPLWMVMHDVRRGGIIAAGAVVIYAGLRLGVGSAGGPVFEYSFGQMSIFAHPLEMFKDAVVGSLPLYAVAVIGFLFQRTEEQQRMRPILFLFIAASVIPAAVATDTGRMLLGIAPLAVALCGSFFSAVRFSGWGIAVIVFSAAVGFAYLPVTFVPISDWLLYRKAVIAAAMALLTIVCGAYLFRYKQTERIRR